MYHSRGEEALEAVFAQFCAEKFAAMEESAAGERCYS